MQFSHRAEFLETGRAKELLGVEPEVPDQAGKAELATFNL